MSKKSSSLVKRDAKGRIIAGSASLNGNSQRRINRMREYMDEKFGDDARVLLDRLDQISRGDLTIEVKRDLATIRKRQGNAAAFDPTQHRSEPEYVEVVPSIRERLDATTVLLQYQLGRPSQQVDMTVETNETHTIDLSQIPEHDLKSYHEALKKLAVYQDAEIVDGEFEALPALIKTETPEAAKEVTHREASDAPKNEETA